MLLQKNSLLETVRIHTHAHTHTPVYLRILQTRIRRLVRSDTRVCMPRFPTLMAIPPPTFEGQLFLYI